MGSSHATSGVCQDRQTTGFLRDAGLQEHGKFFPQPPWVERMRSTGDQGRNACVTRVVKDWSPRA